jgi:radical SAM protein with 4Fe4S-binding SPASM domain
MTVLAAMIADLRTTPLGTRSRLAHELAGVPVLRRTVERVARVNGAKRTYVLCPPAQYDECVSLLAGVTARVMKYDAPTPPWARLVQTARKWSLDGWRGGIGGTTWFDEYVLTAVLAGLLKSEQADAVLVVPPAAPLFDPGLADEMIEYFIGQEEDVRLTFAQTPPGISGVVLDASLVYELLEKNIPVGWTFSYKPDAPRKDAIFEACCYEVPASLRHAAGRLIVDTDRAFETASALLAEHEDSDGETIGRRLAEREATFVHPSPREVEIELTTDDPYPDALLRPRGPRVEHRGPIREAVVEEIARFVGRYDDGLIALGGFGDPLCHPRLESILQTIRSANDGRGVYGLALRTTLADLQDGQAEALVAAGVDVVSVSLDAWSAPLYAKLQSPGDPSAADLEAVVRRMEHLSASAQEHNEVKPIVLPEMTKARDNVCELDAFYDGWIGKMGAACVVGFSHRAGQVEDRGVMSMAPTGRFGCRRIQSRCLVLADGRVTVCDQDVNGKYTVGRIGEESFENLWRSAELERIRDAHKSGVFDPTPLCAACEEWQRP